MSHDETTEDLAMGLDVASDRVDGDGVGVDHGPNRVKSVVASVGSAAAFPHALITASRPSMVDSPTDTHRRRGARCGKIR